MELSLGMQLPAHYFPRFVLRVQWSEVIERGPHSGTAADLLSKAGKRGRPEEVLVTVSGETLEDAQPCDVTDRITCMSHDTYLLEDNVLCSIFSTSVALHEDS